jgi:hypothetical protein
MSLDTNCGSVVEAAQPKDRGGEEGFNLSGRPGRKEQRKGGDKGRVGDKEGVRRREGKRRVSVKLGPTN